MTVVIVERPNLQTFRTPLGAVGRVMQCNGPCHMLVDVLEASNTGPHRHLNPATYICGDCLTTGPGKENAG